MDPVALDKSDKTENIDESESESDLNTPIVKKIYKKNSHPKQL